MFEVGSGHAIAAEREATVMAEYPAAEACMRAEQPMLGLAVPEESREAQAGVLRRCSGCFLAVWFPC